MSTREGINGCDLVVTAVTADSEMGRVASSPLPKRKSKKGRSHSPESFCLCGDGDGDMIGCDGPSCNGGGWYHADCLQEALGISAMKTKRMRGDWLCPSCSEKAAKAPQSSKKQPKSPTSFTVPVFREGDFVLSSVDKKAMSIAKGGGVLSSLPPLRVEAAERQSREEMEKVMASARVLEFEASGNVLCKFNKGVEVAAEADFPHGLSKLSLSANTLAAIQSLHEEVVSALQAGLRLTPWAGVGESDARKRGYAFLPSRFGKFGKGPLTAAGVRFHAAEKRGSEARKDEEANWNSCFRLTNTQVTSRHEEALREVIAAVAAAVPEKYKSCVTLEQLQAIQPNLHSGRDHLPLHIDSPLNDGFGVVIVTICVQRDAHILLQSSTSARAWSFHAPEGCLYVLAGPSRNACDHGVVCPLEPRSREPSSKKQQLLQTVTAKKQQDPHQQRKRRRKGEEKMQRPGRESLNLRFALHGNVPSKAFFVGDEMPLFNNIGDSIVDQHISNSMSYLLSCLLIGCLFVSPSHGSISDISVVTQITSTQVDNGLAFFRSLWHYNSREHVDREGKMYAHACVSTIDSFNFEEQVEKFAKIGVVLHRLHDVTAHHLNKSLTLEEEAEWRNLLCTAQIADHYFMHNVLVMHVLFVSVNFMIVGDLRTTLLSGVSLPSLALAQEQHIFCLPMQVNIEPLSGTIGGMCEMDVFLVSSRLGTDFYGVLNATKPLSLFAHQALEVAARSVSGGILFLRSRAATSRGGDVVVRDGRMWTARRKDSRGVALVEFANQFHTLRALDCHLFLNFEYLQFFKTESILNDIFARGLSHLEDICSDESLFSAGTDLDGLLSSGPVAQPPTLFDLIIFNDEIELLLLRLEFLKPLNMTHVIVESETTFTGQPKPLHFLNNADLFSQYRVHSFVAPLAPASAQDLHDGAVWDREYFSRNSFFSALEHLQARDQDVLLVSDVDEIAHPRALRTLLATHSHTYSHSSPTASLLSPDSDNLDPVPPGRSASELIHSTGYRSRIHKFHQRTYMYSFDCLLRREGRLLSRGALTATTLGYAKQLFGENNHSSLISSVRSHQQHTTPYALEEVLEPGGWHLTFFGGVQRIKSKLSSYSHRNIRRSLVSDAEGEQLEEYGAEAEKFFTLISHKIASGEQIDGRETEKCSRDAGAGAGGDVDAGDEDAARLKQVWAEVIEMMRDVRIS